MKKKMLCILCLASLLSACATSAPEPSGIPTRMPATPQVIPSATLTPGTEGQDETVPKPPAVDEEVAWNENDVENPEGTLLSERDMIIQRLDNTLGNPWWYEQGMLYVDVVIKNSKSETVATMTSEIEYNTGNMRERKNSVIVEEDGAHKYFDETMIAQNGGKYIVAKCDNDKEVTVQEYNYNPLSIGERLSGTKYTDFRYYSQNEEKDRITIFLSPGEVYQFFRWDIVEPIDALGEYGLPGIEISKEKDISLCFVYEDENAVSIKKCEVLIPTVDGTVEYTVSFFGMGTTRDIAYPDWLDKESLQ